MAIALSGGAIEVLWDGENPRTFTGVANEAISGGQFVVVTSSDCVGSTVSSYSPGSIEVNLLSGTSTFYANGIALMNVGSEDLVTVATRGTYITLSSDSISGGTLVYPVSGTSQTVASIEMCAGGNIDSSGIPCGRAITGGGEGNFMIVDFSF